MKKENILLVASIVFGVLVLSFAIFTLLKKDTNTSDDPNPETFSNEQDPLLYEDNLEEENEVEIEQPVEFLHSAWIPAFDFTNGIKSLKENVAVFSIVNPVLYGINTNGTLMSRKPSEERLKELIDFCNENNIQIVPTIGSFDSNTLGSLLKEETHINTHIQEIVSEVEKYSFDGIDIDYEKIKSADKDAYLSFLTDLGEELKKKEKILSVTVVAKTEDGQRDVLFVQDWTVIGKVADQVRIMTYDHTLQTSAIPGPIGPKDWILDVVKYAEGKIPNEKVFLGIHLYAYLWKNDKASALTHDSVLNVLQNTNIQSSYKEDMAEGLATYTCTTGEDCVLYHQTKQGVLERINIAKENKFKGVAYWRLGGQGDLLDFP